ncbi:hypothetical protein M2459_003366 [Parabacteroides sp. PF5-5]|uniref:DUF1573 domain-containing protein n=1 Tax=unclassified Parabacteroides TaxID=2649774 RepID=UPI0024767A2F|nr:MULTISPECIES: DUF1573 domain-containing protein [unclassified Parabacteroides]MDH6306641.1 hypothetical protein [Parabacteroides sp. PH5-39]MDH6317608.1 hypothetical protein [Parabacteroides sp. PF5-13]MDH6321352.1 hypothetical protein [Parabacteroides sp. PH5-13]MDH6325083.1 hypothetical protein [Parabacteroides sp. PH5-8]MDH6328792.1 hypothetical protein [Parabacteroides sp. PH5-41]
MLNRITIIVFFTTLLLFCGQAFAQGSADIDTDSPTHDFGTIAEEDGLASHTFTVKNTGYAPLVITRVTASCGCMQPTWTKEPIEPGKTGEITIEYNPRGRPGPFLKSASVYSNASGGRMSLYLQGTVTPHPKRNAIHPAIVYPYNIGDLYLQTKTVLFSSIRPGETLKDKVAIKNEGESPLTIHFGKTPAYIIAEAGTTVLKPGETSEITLAFKTDEAKRMGHLSAALPLSIESENKKKADEGKIDIAANIIDNFSSLSAAEKAKAPIAEFSSTMLDFGKLPEKSGGILPFIGGKESEGFTITNTGKSTLLIYSATCDNEFIDVSGGKKELKPGASASYKVSVRPKEIKAKLEAFVNVVCNDPNGPVRLIKVTAEK